MSQLDSSLQAILYKLNEVHEHSSGSLHEHMHIYTHMANKILTPCWSHHECHHPKQKWQLNRLHRGLHRPHRDMNLLLCDQDVMQLNVPTNSFHLHGDTYYDNRKQRSTKLHAKRTSNGNDRRTSRVDFTIATFQ